jgi:hypothetical protein
MSCGPAQLKSTGSARQSMNEAQRKDAREGRLFLLPNALRQISRITGMINGRRLVLFWMYRFRSLRIFSLITP